MEDRLLKTREERGGGKGRREGRRYGLALGALPFNAIFFSCAGFVCDLWADKK